MRETNITEIFLNSHCLILGRTTDENMAHVLRGPISVPGMNWLTSKLCVTEMDKTFYPDSQMHTLCDL